MNYDSISNNFVTIFAQQIKPTLMSCCKHHGGRRSLHCNCVARAKLPVCVGRLVIKWL